MPSALPGLDLGSRRDRSEPVTLPPSALLRHVLMLGSSGSGKTVLAKVVVEEALRRGIPAICVDPQGDLASLVTPGDPRELAARGVDPELVRALAERLDPVVFTPASSKGIPLCADPLERGLDSLEPSEQLQAFTRNAAMVVSLLGYDLDSDEGAGLAAALDTVLGQLAAAGRPAESLHALAAHLGELEGKGFPGLERLVEPKRLRTALQRLARLDVGARRLLFHEGIPIDIDLLLGRAGVPTPAGKTRLSVVYLNTLHSQEDKDFFVAALASRLYSWMLAHPSSEPQLLFYIDEVAPYLPPVRKPAAKEPLVLLFKQARKYGVGCLMATQNPGDVDYKAMAQFGTWGLGRLTTRQDLKKLAPAIKSLAPTASDAILDALPALKPGELVLLSPDHFSEPCPLRTRWLATRHATYDDEQIAALTSPELRARFARLQGAAVETRPVARTQPMPAVPLLAAPVPPVAAPAAPAPAAPPPPAPAPVAPTRDEELAAFAATLARAPSMSAVEFATAAGVGESRARKLLAELVEAGFARAFKPGRAVNWFAIGTGARPDLELPAKVSAVAPRIDGAAVQRLAQELARTPLFGFVGAAELLERVELLHRLVYRVDFEEAVERPVFGGLFGTAKDQRLGSVYLHPRSLALLTFHPLLGLAFSPRPAEHASDVADLDGASVFVEVPPASLALDDADVAPRRSAEEVAAALRQRYAVVPRRVAPVFVPLWRLVFRTGTGTSYRVVLLDALVGKAVEWG